MSHGGRSGWLPSHPPKKESRSNRRHTHVLLDREMVLKKPDKPLDFLFALASETFADAEDF